MPTTVLVIDDDQAIRETLRTLLADEGGYAVIEAADPAHALDLLRTTPEGLVVLFDYRMPRLDGAGLLALAAQELGLTERHTFVCLTGANPARLPATLADLLARYGVPLVTKPFDIDDLLATVQQAAQRLARLPAQVRPTRPMPTLKREPRVQARGWTEQPWAGSAVEGTNDAARAT